MPIVPDEPPAASIQAMREAMKNLPEVYRQLIGDVLAAPGRRWPHPVYVVGLADLAATHALKRAALIGWRFLAQAEGDRNYAVEVQREEGETGHVWTELDKGPYIDGLRRVLEDPQIARQIGRTVVRPAMLRAGAMGLCAVWLRAEPSAGDVIIPIPPAPRCLQPWQTYSVAQFEDALRSQAKEQLADESSDA